MAVRKDGEGGEECRDLHAWPEHVVWQSGADSIRTEAKFASDRDVRFVSLTRPQHGRTAHRFRTRSLRVWDRISS